MTQNHIMENKYVITKEQLDFIDYIKDMLNVNAETIKKLCNEEKSDIQYGFELGNVYSHLMANFKDMMLLIDDIKYKENLKENLEISDPEKESIDFTTKELNSIKCLLSDDYKLGFKQGVERYIISINKNN